MLRIRYKDTDSFLQHLHGAEFVGFVTSAGVGINAATMDAMPGLRVVSSFGVGLDKLDLAAAKARGVRSRTRPTCSTTTWPT
ncbi:MAG: hypothetical protein MZW92_00785 [Comamonadaceae bacterium]|nr:hypothetical protein [Comamonadaceae bacterium]